MTSNVPNKSLGQHWLNDQQTLENIVRYANLSKKDYVVEIGPGLGSLTSIISAQAGKVLSIEIDEQLFKVLQSENKLDNLEFVNQDILKFDLTKLPKDYKLVANIPYYLTSHLIRILTQSADPPVKIVLLIQKEVAERIAAKPGAMSLISVVTQKYYDVEKKDIISPKLFTPPPKVDSQVIVLSRRVNQKVKDINNEDFFRLVRIGFSARRKTLENSLANGARLDKQVVKKMIAEANLDPMIRPQALSLEDWDRIYKIFTKRNII